MAIELRRSTPSDIPFVLSAERDGANSPFVGSWSEEQHRGVLSDPDVAHCIVTSLPDQRAVSSIIISGLLNQYGSV